MFSPACWLILFLTKNKEYCKIAADTKIVIWLLIIFQKSNHNCRIKYISLFSNSYQPLYSTGYISTYYNLQQNQATIILVILAICPYKNIIVAEILTILITLNIGKKSENEIVAQQISDGNVWKTWLDSYSHLGM